ncbi:hypothetical protein F2Q70_00001119 [Brassica cretica]|uniref:Uncharacterized protein n=1 Tax=Brassica cretica TaxID=69181 RepID=A0A8S9IYV9_BRACR|nr:hypothetical protein F2Q70_00001119 [Brassica cretica]
MLGCDFVDVAASLSRSVEPQPKRSIKHSRDGVRGHQRETSTGSAMSEWILDITSHTSLSDTLVTHPFSSPFQLSILRPPVLSLDVQQIDHVIVRHIAWMLLVPPAITQGLFGRGHVTFLSPPKILAVAPRVLL